jgi:hypothetical protein
VDIFATVEDSRCSMHPSTTSSTVCFKTSAYLQVNKLSISTLPAHQATLEFRQRYSYPGIHQFEAQ